MPRRKTIEEVVDIFANKGFKLLENEYKNKDIPMNCIDIYGYKYKLSLACLKSKTGGNSKFAIYNPFTIFNIIHYIEMNNLSCKLLSTEYKNMKEDKLTFKCECGLEYDVSLGHFLSSKQFKCKKCKHRDRGNRSRLPLTEIKNKVENTSYILLEDGFVNSKNNIFIQDLNGYRYKTNIYNVVNLSKPEKFGNGNPFTLYNVQIYINNNNLNLILSNNNTDIDIYNIKKHLVKFRCFECGEEYSTTISRAIYLNKNRCDRCTKKQSNIEFCVEQYLIQKKINYIKEKRFNDCRDKKPLPFDFYLKDYNLCVELHGSQHYYETDFFTQTLKDRQRLDKIKEQYCINNNIKILIIPYWSIQKNGKEQNKYKEIIDNILG